MLTVASLTTDIRRELGGSALEVEIQDCDTILAITKALEQINRYVPGEGYGTIAASSAVKRYVVTHRGFIGITDINFMDPDQPADQLSDNPFLNYQHGIGYLGELTRDTAASEAMQTMGYLHDFRKIYSSLPEWNAVWEYNADEDKQEYAVYIDLPRGLPQYQVSYRYLFQREATDSNENGLPSITPNFAGWVRDYSVACAREILGDIRNKFTGIPNPDGGNSEVDGREQIDRASNEKMRLIEDLQARQRQLPIVFA